MNKVLKLGIALTSVLVLGACSNQDSDKSKASSDDNVVMWVQFSKESAEGQVMEESVKEFNDSNDKSYTAKVEYIPRSGSGGGYEDKVNAALTTNTLPDIITLDGPNTAAYANSKVIQPLGEYISNQEDLLDSIIEQGTYENELYAVGYSESSVGMYYNENMLKEAGIDLATLPTVENPWNWDQFNEMFNTLHEHFKGPILDMGFDDHSEWLTYAFAPFIWSAGGDITNEDGTKSTGNLNSNESIKGFEFIQNLVEKDFASITPTEAGFQTEKYPLKFSGSWTMQELDSEYKDLSYGIMPYPVSPETTELVSPSGSWQYGLTTATEKKDAAGALIDFLVSEQELYDMSVGNTVLPARQSVADKLLKEVGEPMKVLIEQNQVSGKARPVLVNYPQVSRFFQETVTESTYFDQNEDIEALLKGKAAEIDNYLE